jgi:hypothetical protein
MYSHTSFSFHLFDWSQRFSNSNGGTNNCVTLYYMYFEEYIHGMGKGYTMISETREIQIPFYTLHMHMLRQYCTKIYLCTHPQPLYLPAHPTSASNTN